MRGPSPEVPETPYYDRIQGDEDRAERTRAAEAENDYDGTRDAPAPVGRGRWLVYVIVGLAVVGLLILAYLLAGYLVGL